MFYDVIAGSSCKSGWQSGSARGGWGVHRCEDTSGKLLQVVHVFGSALPGRNSLRDTSKNVAPFSMMQVT
jgi:hypothetical protein